MPSLPLMLMGHWYHSLVRGNLRLPSAKKMIDTHYSRYFCVWFALCLCFVA
uniref:Uncharacterized protein n=2 Tax=Picea TaxID=3328 RepID=A0A101M1E6_PICGL|nr:hypothetical protein ABT39_MTgene3687 [Picea glauca]QHR90329.1 hypothetical protein Q903MT_gene4352 [Picea sitchensis]